MPARPSSSSQYVEARFGDPQYCELTISNRGTNTLEFSLTIFAGHGLARRHQCVVSQEMLYRMANVQPVLAHVANEFCRVQDLVSENTLISYLEDMYSHGKKHLLFHAIQHQPIWYDYNIRVDSSLGPDEWYVFGNPPYHFNPEKIREADELAHKLLLDHLSDSQRKSYESSYVFAVNGQKSGLAYEIHKGRVINVTRHNTDGTKQKLCLVQESNVPLEDQLLAQKLLIENDEETFLKKANWIQ